ncbi:MAG: hypothetical protein EOP46_17270 [Sphingobacteriaceae bacterium]|nr:MAG: hypothetical protein EOP46_17270 [Sphingobacteriaceae bacterium]
MLKICRVLLLCLFIAAKAGAQITVTDPKKYNDIKNGITYIIVKTMNFPGANKYLEALQKNWTLTKEVHYLPYDKAGIVLKPNDSFLRFEALTLSSGNVTNIFYYLSFWTMTEKDIRKNRSLDEARGDEIARVILSVNIREALSPRKFFENTDFHGSGILFNWSPGMLKNYMQQMTRLLNAGEKLKAKDDITNKTALAKLSIQTLYVPDFCLKKTNMFTGKVKEAAEDDNRFKDYHYAYKVITTDQLDEMILKGSEPVYYLLFIKDSATKLVCVINSQTGETIYSRNTNMAYNLKAGDLDDLYDEIKQSGR